MRKWCDAGPAGRRLIDRLIQKLACKCHDKELGGMCRAGGPGLCGEGGARAEEGLGGIRAIAAARVRKTECRENTGVR
jgi:hypothetical protein